MAHHPELPKAEIRRRVDVTDDLFCLWLEPEVPFPFVAGQYITIGAGGFERPYSIASAPYEPLIELFIEYVPPAEGGKLTPTLHTLRVGDVVTMRPRAKGRFVFEGKVRNHVMLGTVTGVAPYVSIVRQFLHDRAQGAPADDYRFFVMEGASHHDEFVYDTELRRLSEEHPELVEFVGSVSRPHDERNAGWSGPTGRVNLIIEEYLERWKLTTADTIVYLCGHPGMIEDAKQRLGPKGWTIVEERFWRP